LALAAFDPPLRAKMAIGAQKARTPLGGTIDIGALEEFESTGGGNPIRVNGSQPLIPPRNQASAASPTPQSAPSAPVPAGGAQATEKPVFRQTPAMRYRRSRVK
jgi:hypothetical protein